MNIDLVLYLGYGIFSFFICFFAILFISKKLNNSSEAIKNTPAIVISGNCLFLFTIATLTINQITDSLYPINIASLLPILISPFLLFLAQKKIKKKQYDIVFSIALISLCSFSNDFAPFGQDIPFWLNQILTIPIAI